MDNKKKIITILLYAVYLIVLFELSARFVFLNPQLSGTMLARDSLSWRRSWIERHESTGMQIYYKFDVYDQSKGWISKPCLKDMNAFKDKVLNTNSNGLRGKTDFNYGNDRSRIRILILGDSFTFGDEVSDNETYPYYLQELIPSAEVINLGMHGYGHDQMLILLQEEGIKYEPDIIILGFIVGDMERNLLNFRDYAKPRFVLDNKRLRLTGSPVPTPEETMKWDWARPRIVDIVSFIEYKLKQLFGSSAREEDAITTAILIEIIDVADSIKAVPIFVYIPRNTGEISVSPRLTPGEKYLFAMCQADDRVRCFSALPRFAEKMTNGIPFRPQEGGHWGPAANLEIAEAIKRYLVDEGFLGLRDGVATIRPKQTQAGSDKSLAKSSSHTQRPDQGPHNDCAG